MEPAENVIDMNDKILENIGARIDTAWRHVKESDANWVESSIDLMQALREGRERFKADQDFGKWLDDGHDHWNKNDRAALIGMAGDLALAREVLTQTDRRSYDRIWREVKDRFPHTRKPPKAKTEPKPDKPPRMRGLQLDPEVAKKIAEEVLDDGLSQEAVAAKYEVGTRKVVEKAVQYALGRRDGVKEVLDASEAEKFDEKGKLRIEEAIRISKERLLKNFHNQVEEEVRARVVKLEQWEKQENIKLREENRVLRSALMQKAPFTALEFKKLLMCVHPDNSASVDVRNEVLQLLNTHETRLVKPAEGVKIKSAKRRIGTIMDKINEAMGHGQV